MKSPYALQGLARVLLLGALVHCLAIIGLAQRVPVIFDTDIGDDIDDTWALAMILKSPDLDLKLVTTTCGKAEYRAKLVARLLTVAQRTAVPIGLGAGGREGDGGQAAWVQDYKLTSYPGKIYDDGVQALVDLLTQAPAPVTIISVGPSHTVAAALQRQPEIARHAVFVGMQGSVRKGYDGGAPCAEYNVKANVPAAQQALLAPWKKTVITPLDTCGLVRISGDGFQALTQSNDPLVKAVLENYRIWAKKDRLTESSVLFDTVAVYLAKPGPKPLLQIEDLKINVNGEGFTTIDPQGMPMAVATDWKDLNGYADWALKLLLSPATP
jgi:inosine-uridine nucleoside N-ribohydrolase